MTTTADDFLKRLLRWGPVRASVERGAVCRQLPDGKQPVTPWSGGPVDPRNTHWSVGLFRHNDPQDGGKFRRRADTWTGNIAILLDDIREKAKPPALEPTVKIRTKAGSKANRMSEQWVYVFREAMRDAGAIDALMRALCAADHADPGGSLGKTSLIRLGRLPGSDPKGRAYGAEIVFEDWNRLFPPDAARMAAAFGLTLPKPRPILQRDIRTGAVIPVGLDPMANWLSANGHAIGQRRSAGWIPIRCPWSNQHTDGVVTGTDYHSGNPAGFNCFHAACRKRGALAFLEHYRSLGAPDVALVGDGPDPAPIDRETLAETVIRRLRAGGRLPRAWQDRERPERRLPLARALAAGGLPYDAVATALDLWGAQGDTRQKRRAAVLAVEEHAADVAEHEETMALGEAAAAATRAWEEAHPAGDHGHGLVRTAPILRPPETPLPPFVPVERTAARK